MGAQIRIGRIFGVPISVHYSWFVIALLITLSLATHFRATSPDWSAVTVWVSAVLTSALFFAGLLVHELSHALVARARHLPVGGITLFALGGVSRIERESQDAKSEFLIGIVGPVTSVLVGLGCLGLAGALGWRPGAEPSTPPQAVLAWLGYINFGLAAFNMIPGFPLDGGRVLRAAVWAITHNAERATRIASRGGQIVAFLFIAYGITRMFAGAAGGGLWLVLIGWFLMTAAAASYGRMEAISVLRTVRASEVMSRECPTIDPRLPISTFVADHLLHTGRRCFLVLDGHEVAGLLTASDLKAVPRQEWDQRSVASVMRPMDQVRTVSPDTPASECFELMTSQDVHQLPVIEKGQVRGVVSRGDLMRVLRTKAELGI